MIKISKRTFSIIRLIMYCILLLGCCSFFFLLGNVNPSYISVILLPLIYSIVFVIITSVNTNKRMDLKLLILLLFFIKIYLLPLIIFITGDFDLISYNGIISEKILQGVIIQVIELLSITITFLLSDSQTIKYETITYFKSEKDKEINKKIWKMFFALTLIVIVFIIIFPTLLLKYRPLFFTNEAQEIAWRRTSHIAASNIHPLIYYPINWLITIMRIGISYLIVVKIWKISRRKHPLFYVGISMFIILLILIVYVPDDVAASIIASLSILILLTKMYPSIRGYIKNISIILVGMLFLYVFIYIPISTNGDLILGLSSLSKKINAYFSGIINVSGSTLMESNQKVEYFFGDFLRSLPVLKGFFVNLPRSTELFNSALGYDVIYNSQIIPLEGQAYFYFNYIGVIFIPIIMIKLCVFFYDKMSVSAGTYSSFCFTFFTLLFCFGIVMYDPFLCFDLFLNYSPLLMFNFLRKRVKNNESINIS